MHKKKILLLIPGYSSFLLPVSETFSNLGWQVKNIDYRRGDLLIRIFRFIPLIGGHKRANTEIGKLIINTAKKNHPDLVLVIKGESISPTILKKIKQYSKLVVNWFPDPLNHWDTIKKISCFYDYFFHFDPLIVRRMKKIGFKNVFYLPFAVKINTNLKESKKKYAVTFIGTYSKTREKYLQVLINYDLNIWGDKRWYKSGLKKFTRGGRISQTEMAKIIQKSDININIHGFWPTEGTNLRTFEVTSNCGFLLTEYVKDFENLFRIDKEIVCFNSPEELVKKIDYYIKRKKEQIRIARCGHVKTSEKHSYVKRIKQMLSIINNE